MTPFAERAAILLARGIPVAPVLSGQKRCFLRGWPDLASTDYDQIDYWALEYPNANTAAVCFQDGFAVLDADTKELPVLIREETGQLVPETFTVLSGGKGFPHFYFSHTARSRALGNCSVTRGDEHLADFQAHRKYVVGPGSALSEGGIYRIASDAPIVPIPDWLVDWLQANGVVEKPRQYATAKSGELRVAEDFDFEAFVAHYGITGRWSGTWFVTDSCPVAGHKHDGSKHTGFYFDGVRIGFHCFAAACEGMGMSFGQVLKHMNQDHPPYKGEIWRDDDADKWITNWRGGIQTLRRPLRDEG